MVSILDAAYQLTPEELYTVDKQIHYWHSMALQYLKHREWCPVVDRGGFKSFEERWYNVVRPGRPIETPDLREARAFVAALEQGSEDVVFHHMDLEIPWSTLQASRAGGFDIKEISMASAIRQLALQEAKFLFQGASVPSINGLSGAAGNTSTDTTDLWHTAPGAVNVIADMASANFTDEFMGPFVLVLSENLKYGTTLYINATPTGPWTQEDGIAKILGGEGRIYYSKITPATQDLMRVYPLPAASSNDGVAFLVEPSPENFKLIIEQPLTTVIGDYDVRRKCYPIMVFQAMTIQVREANSICKHLTVNFA